MIFKITREQLRTLLIMAMLFLSIWLLMGHFARFVVEEAPEGSYLINVSFLAPMNHLNAAHHLTITCSDFPEKKVDYQCRWISRNTLQIAIKETNYPRGLGYKIGFEKAPAMIPPFSVTVEKKVRLQLIPKAIGLSPQDFVPTTGPFTLIFNTPINPKNFKNHVSINIPGNFLPQVEKLMNSPRYDYSRWVFTPNKRLNNNTQYKITINKGLQSSGGGTTSQKQELYFTSAPALKIFEIYPRPFDPSIWLSRQIYIKANQDLKKAKIQVEGMVGKVQVTKDSAVFKPEHLFLPAQKYKVTIHLTSSYGESLASEFWYGTTNLGKMRWLAIKLGDPCNVQVYEGNKPATSFPGWLTIPQDKVPRVTMYENKRGSSSEHNPQDTSPIRYIKLNADIMIHHQNASEPHDHNLSGLPPSYGCILLNKPDFDWIFNHLPPANCMVIVH